MPKPVLLEIEKTFNCPVIEAYGMTEASHQIASNPLPQGKKNGTVGIGTGPLVEIMDKRKYFKKNKVGGVIKGETVIKQYVNNEKATLSSFKMVGLKLETVSLMQTDI